MASDPAPHAQTEKEVEFELAATGLVGLETSLGLSLRLVTEGILSLSDLVEKMSLAPSRILKVPGGTLAPGSPADITVMALDRPWRVDKDRLRSRSRNTPFHGWILPGRAVLTIKGGRVVYRDILP